MTVLTRIRILSHKQDSTKSLLNPHPLLPDPCYLAAYLLSGPARTEQEHSIPLLAALRYSITFPNLREG